VIELSYNEAKHKESGSRGLRKPVKKREPELRISNEKTEDEQEQEA